MRIIKRCKDPSRIVAFTGHRNLAWGGNERHPLCGKTQRLMADAILAMCNDGKNTFINGLALGADAMFALEILLLRSEGYRVHLIAAIPSEQQTSLWKPADRERYIHIREQCDALYVHDSTGKMDFGRACIGRDDWMVDNANALIAYYDGRKRGGTAHTFHYAVRQNKPLINLWINTESKNEHPLISGRSPPDKAISNTTRLNRTQIPENSETSPRL